MGYDFYNLQFVLHSVKLSVIINKGYHTVTTLRVYYSFNHGNIIMFFFIDNSE
jgi:hypothetical protein